MNPLGQLNAHLDLVDLERAIMRYVRELGLQLPHVVRRTFRLIMRDVMSITAPKSQAQGRKAVGRDIGRAIFLLDAAKASNWGSLRRAILANDRNAVRAILRRTKKGKWKRFRDVVAFNKTYHIQARDNRGRVRRKYPEYATMDRGAYRRYVAEIRGHVGFTRSGWAPGARMAGANVPNWVGKHTGPPGVAHDNTANQTKPTMTAIHRGKTTSSIPMRQIRDVIRKRTKTMHKDVDRVLRGGASRYF